jgi:cobalamin biosynthesis Mg chelatase CobN
MLLTHLECRLFLRAVKAKFRQNYCSKLIKKIPKTVALVLWGSDNIKSDGQQIAQALALIGAVPRFDSFGRLSGADLIPLEKLGRPRIDVVMTLSGIFRDLLPLQTKMLAEAAYKAAPQTKILCRILFAQMFWTIWLRLAVILKQQL